KITTSTRDYSIRPYASQRTAVLSVRLGRNRGTFAGGIVISCPVRGLRPLRAARLATTNVPNPLMVARFPRRNDSEIPATNAFIAAWAAVLEPPAFLAMIATRSALVILRSDRTP